MSNEDITISAGVLSRAIAEMIDAAASDPRLAVGIAEAALCMVVAKCVNAESVPKWLANFPSKASKLIADLRLVMEETEMMQ